MQCSMTTKSGTPCQMPAVGKTNRCWSHSYTKERTEAQRKAAAVTNAKKLDRAQQKLNTITQKQTDALPGVIAKAERAGVELSDATFEDLPRYSAYIASLLLEGRITAPVGQALIAAGRLAVQAKEAEVDLMDLKLMQQRRTGR